MIILGAGPIRIGQGIEFDYLTVHAVRALKKRGVKAIVINNNPETVSTDYSISDRLYFEPLTLDFVLRVIEKEKEGLLGVMPQFGGQTAINLVYGLKTVGVKVLGTPPDFIEASEDRSKTVSIISRLGYKMPEWSVTFSKNETVSEMKKLGYPLLFRPSYVLGGEGMFIAFTQKEAMAYLSHITDEIYKKPVLIDKFIDKAIEVDIDFISDGRNVVSFILEQLDPAGIHSGDSRCVYPPQNLSQEIQSKLKRLVEKISKAFHIVGIANLQCAIKDNQIYILEINPRASRTVPFISKAVKYPITEQAVNLILGERINEAPLLKNNKQVYIKAPVFSFDKMVGLERKLGPLMKSTGETMSVGKDINEALAKLKNPGEIAGKGIYPQ